MKIVALTGGIGSGKSEVARIFAQLGVPIIDTDVIAHQLTSADQPALLEIREAFGKSFIDTEGALDRKKMRELIFDNPEARKKLEHILHPKIREAVLTQLNTIQLKAPPQVHYKIVVVPLLFETNQYAHIATVNLAVDCTPALQIARTMARSQLTEDAVNRIMQTQVSRESRLKRADEVIENNGDINELSVKVHQMHEKLNKRCVQNPTNV